MKKAAKFMAISAIAAASLFAGKGLFAQKAAPLPEGIRKEAAKPQQKQRPLTYRLCKDSTISLADSSRANAELRVFSMKGVKVSGLMVRGKKDGGYLNGKLEYVKGGQAASVPIHVSCSGFRRPASYVYSACEQPSERASDRFRKPPRQSRLPGFKPLRSEALTAGCSVFMDNWLLPYAGLDVSWRLHKWNDTWLTAAANFAVGLKDQRWGGVVYGNLDDGLNGRVTIRSASARNAILQAAILPTFGGSTAYGFFGLAVGLIGGFGSGTDTEFSFKNGQGKAGEAAQIPFNTWQGYFAPVLGGGVNLGAKMGGIEISAFWQLNIIIMNRHPAADQLKGSPSIDMYGWHVEYKYLSKNSDLRFAIPIGGIRVSIPLKYGD